MPSRGDLDVLYRIGSQLAPAVHEAQNWPYDVPHAQYEASLWPPHDVGGQPDAPVRYEEKEEEQWELNTYVTCEVLGWKGVWNAEERRRRRDTATPSAIRDPHSAFRIPYLRSEDRWARDSRVHSGVHEDRFSTTWFLACRWRRKLFKTFGTRSGRCRPSAEPFLN